MSRAERDTRVGGVPSALVLVVLFAVSAVAAQAQLYRWVDENGKVHYSDIVPPAANERPRAKLRPDGIVLERADRAPSAEERRALAARAGEIAKERAAAEARARQDRALLDRYESMAEFDRVAERRLQEADDQLKALTAREPGLTQRIRTLLGQNPRPESKEYLELQALAVDAQMLSDQIVARLAAREALLRTIGEERARLATLLAEQEGRTASSTTGSTPAMQHASGGPKK
ncbi:MAG: DUF4124 domain-containing protein [Casimicrobiaceae bacterium]